MEPIAPAKSPAVIEAALETLSVMADLAHWRTWVVTYGGAEPLVVERPGSVRGLPSALLSQDEIVALAAQATGGAQRSASTPEGAWRAVPWRSNGISGAIVFGTREAADEAQLDRVAGWARATLERSTGSFEAGILGAEILRMDAGGAILAATPGASALLLGQDTALVGEHIDALLARASPGFSASAARIASGETMRLWLTPGGRPEVCIEVERRTHDRGELVATLRPGPHCHDDLRRRDRLIAAIRHEIRAPLTVLRGVVSILEEEPDMEARDRQEFVRSLRRETSRVIAFVEDMLTLGRFTTGRGIYRFEPVDAAAAARDTVQRLQKTPEAAGLVVQLRVCEGPAMVRGEVELVHQFFRCLLGHALRAAPPGVSASLDVSVDGGRVRIVLRDDGPPATDEGDAATLVTFRRSTSDGKYLPGAAIGIPVAKKIADAHGWAMRAHRTADGWNVLEVDAERALDAAAGAPAKA